MKKLAAKFRAVIDVPGNDQMKSSFPSNVGGDTKISTIRYLRKSAESAGDKTSLQAKPNKEIKVEVWR
jgi:hypothetical protein